MRRFLPPWTVEALDGGFKVVDANRQTLAMLVSYLAQKFGISNEDARKLIDRFGGNRDKIYAAAETLKQGRQTWLLQPFQRRLHSALHDPTPD